MHFDKEERKQINRLLTERGIRDKGSVFALIDSGANHEDVFDYIRWLTTQAEAQRKPEIVLRDEPIAYDIYGEDIVDENAVSDMNSIARLPYVTDVKLMPDGHRVKENHVPVGGVVLSDCILPGVVGSDIACSVRLTITNLEVDDAWFDKYATELTQVLQEHTYFGLDANPNIEAIHGYRFYLERIGLAHNLRSHTGKYVWEKISDSLESQFGTSGDGNHFVEFGTVNVVYDKNGEYVKSDKRHFAILSHFGSRSIGSTIAKAFVDYANEQVDMPKGMTDAPLNPDVAEGADYWGLMQFAGDFAKFGHEWLHTHLITELEHAIGCSVDKRNSIYSRHNYAWATVDGFLHRKGSTPAALDEYGVIPATMGDETKIVLGTGNPRFLRSASHGAGRTHSRSQANKEFGSHNTTAEYLWENYRVKLIGGGADEDPRAYKSIDEVMKYQTDSVIEIGGFRPKVVRMAPPRQFHWKKKAKKRG